MAAEDASDLPSKQSPDIGQTSTLHFDPRKVALAVALTLSASAANAMPKAATVEASSPKPLLQTILQELQAKLPPEYDKEASTIPVLSQNFENYAKNFENYAKNFENYAKNFENYARNFENYGRNFENPMIRMRSVGESSKAISLISPRLPNGACVPENADAILGNRRDRAIV